MDYKVELQNNNAEIKNNNIDLTTILNTINALPEAGTGETVDLDSEIIEQNNIIDQIQLALSGKSANTGVDTSDATATAEDIVVGKTAYVNGNKVTGTHECSGSSGQPVEQVQVTIEADGNEDYSCIYYSNGEMSAATIHSMWTATTNTFNVDVGSLFIIVSSYVYVVGDNGWTNMSDDVCSKVITASETVTIS